VIAVYAIVTIITLQGKIRESESANAALRQQAEEQSDVNAGLQRDLDNADDPESYAQTARDAFGLVDSDETRYYDIGA